MLVSGENIRQKIPARRIHRFLRQPFHDAHILLDVLNRKAQQPLNVRADVVRLKGCRVQHEEGVIHVDGQLGEQLVPVEDLPVLSVHADAGVAGKPYQQQHGQAGKHAADNHQRACLKPVHAGIDHTGGNNANHHQVLNACRLIDQIIAGFPQPDGYGAGLLLPEVLPQGGDFSITEFGVFLSVASTL